jgi:hypothetical protein
LSTLRLYFYRRPSHTFSSKIFEGEPIFFKKNKILKNGHFLTLSVVYQHVYADRVDGSAIRS